MNEVRLWDGDDASGGGPLISRGVTLELPCPMSSPPPWDIFLVFSKCGCYVLSYTSSSGDNDLSSYIYDLDWCELNVQSKLKLVPYPSPVWWTLPSSSWELPQRLG